MNASVTKSCFGAAFLFMAMAARPAPASPFEPQQSVSAGTHRAATVASPGRTGPGSVVASNNNECNAPVDIVAPFPATVAFNNTQNPGAGAGATTGTQGQMTCPSPGGSNALDLDLWYRWASPATTGLATITTCNLTTVNTKIAVYASTACTMLPAPIACNDDFCGTQSSVTFQYAPSTTYTIQLGSSPGNPGGTGSFTLSICNPRNRATAGSLLVYPEYDNTTPDALTLATVTHVVANPNLASGAHFNTIKVEVVYINAATVGCSESTNQHYRLTPYDTFSWLPKLLSGNSTRGYFYLFARLDTVGPGPGGAPIVFNSLIGMQTQIDGIDAFDYALNAISFRTAGTTDAQEGTTGGLNATGDRLLNDIDEYEGAPDQILIPRFLGQGHATYNTASDIILLSLSGGTQLDIGGFVLTDTGYPHSIATSFSCWTKDSLVNVFPTTANAFLQVVDDTQNAPNEIFGLPDLHAGWIQLNSTNTPDRAFYAVLIERAGGDAAATLPFEFCSQADGRVEHQ